MRRQRDAARSGRTIPLAPRSGIVTLAQLDPDQRDAARPSPTMAHGKTGYEQQGGQERPFRLQHRAVGLDRVHRLVTSKPLAAACAPSLDCQHKNCAWHHVPPSKWARSRSSPSAWPRSSSSCSPFGEVPFTAIKGARECQHYPQQRKLHAHALGERRPVRLPTSGPLLARSPPRRQRRVPRSDRHVVRISDADVSILRIPSPGFLDLTHVFDGLGAIAPLSYSQLSPFASTRLAATLRKRSSAVSRFSTISAAISSGGGSRSSWTSSGDQPAAAWRILWRCLVQPRRLAFA